MADETSKTPESPTERPSPQNIPLAKIHDLPGVFIPKQPDKSYGGLVSSIQASGVKEPVILRLREDGEYQLVTGYRRRRGSELAKKQDILAFVYEMTLQEAVDYHRRVQNQPALPIPGKLFKPTAEKKAEQPVPTAVSMFKEPTEGKAENKPGNKTTDTSKETATVKGSPAPKEGKGATATPAADPLKPREQPIEGKSEGKPDAKTADTPKATAPAKSGPAPKEGKETSASPAAGAPKPKEPTESKTEAKPDGKTTDTPKETAPAKSGPVPKEGKEGPVASIADTPKAKEQPTEGKTEAKPDGKVTDTPKGIAPAKDDSAPKESKEAPTAPAAAPTPKAPTESTAEARPIVAGPTAKGPAGTQITQVFEDRLAPPDEKALNDLPSPKEGESYFIRPSELSKK